VIVIGHHSLVSVTVLVVGLVRQPINYAWDVLRDIVLVKLELRIILEVAALVKVGDVNEVPV